MSEPNDHEWILLRERGEDVSHVPEKTRAKYERLTRLFEALPGATPSPGWKQRVFAVVDDPPVHEGVAEPLDPPAPTRARPVRPPSRRTWAVVGGLATAAAFGLFFIIIHPPGGGTEGGNGGTTIALATDPAVTTEIRLGNAQHRSGTGGVSVSIGDTLILHGQADGPFEVRVYGDTGEPLARCTGSQGCAVEREGNTRKFHFEVELQASGDVRAVLFTGASIPAAFESLNADVDAAQRVSVEARQIAFVHVQ